jgi:putative sterol carrier protein
MALDPVTSLASIRSELETGWKLFDDVFATFDPDQWTRQFGRTWTYAELPYHLSYFDGMVAKSLQDGADGPSGERLHIRSMGELNAWNAREFAKRKSGHSVAESLAAMKRSRDAIRAWLQSATDADLDATAWYPLVFGWVKARDVAQTAVVHNVAEYWKLWMSLDKRFPPPSPAAVHLRLGFMMSLMPRSMNRELAARTPFTMTWNFEGPGGGPWTFTVRDGNCTVSEAAAAQPDVAITLKPEDFHRIVTKMASPPMLMLTGKMKVKGLMKMGTFGKLFPEPKPDQILSF